MRTILHTAELSAQARSRITAVIRGELEQRGAFWLLHHRAPVPAAELVALREGFPFDINPLPEAFDPASVRFLLTDMDSTLIDIECIDEIADFAGRKPQVAAVTEAAMRGEIDFATSLTRRVAALEGLEESVLGRVYEERLHLNPGAETLLAALADRGISRALVSGGFTYFTDLLEQRLGLDYARANRLEIRGGRLTGRVSGPIVDAEAKAAFVREIADGLGADPRSAIAMGDGANDLRMMQAAGLGIAYRAKPKVQAEADVVLNHADLSAVLHFLDSAVD